MTKYLSGAVVEEVHLAPRVHRHYSAVATRHNVNVSDLLSEALRRLVVHSELLTSQTPASSGAPAPKPTGRARSLHNHRDEIVLMLSEGMSDTAIAKELGFAQPTVSAFRRKHLGIDTVYGFGGGHHPKADS